MLTGIKWMRNPSYQNSPDKPWKRTVKSITAGIWGLGKRSSTNHYSWPCSSSTASRNNAAKAGYDSLISPSHRVHLPNPQELLNAQLPYWQHATSYWTFGTLLQSSLGNVFQNGQTVRGGIHGSPRLYRNAFGTVVTRRNNRGVDLVQHTDIPGICKSRYVPRFWQDAFKNKKSKFLQIQLSTKYFCGLLSFCLFLRPLQSLQVFLLTVKPSNSISRVVIETLTSDTFKTLRHSRQLKSSNVQAFGLWLPTVWASNKNCWKPATLHEAAWRSTYGSFSTPGKISFSILIITKIFSSILFSFQLRAVHWYSGQVKN